VSVRARIGRAVFPLLAVGATAVVYLPVTRSYFFSDDFIDLLQIVERGRAFIYTMWGGHLLLLRNLIFYVSERSWGFDAQPYYRTLFVTHLLNVWLLFRVIHAFTGDRPLASLGATLWGTSPLCIGTIGWYAVYGHVLATSILLVVLAGVGPVAVRGGGVRPRTALVWCALLLLGTTCFGVAVGLAIVFPLALLLVAPTAFDDRSSRLIFIALPIATIGLYFGYRFVMGLAGSLPLSELVVVRLGPKRLEPVLAMTGHLLAFGLTGLVLGFFFSPSDYPGTASRVVSVVSVAIVVFALSSRDRRRRHRLAGVLLLAVAMDAIIALGRANLYLASGMTWPAIAQQLRYYYAGLVPLMLAICLVSKEALAERGLGRWASLALLGIWLLIAGSGYAHSSWRIDEHAGIRRYVASSLRTMESAVERATGSAVYLTNRPVPVMMLGPGNPPVTFPGWAALFVVAHPEAPTIESRRIYFIESDPALVREVRTSGMHPKLAAMLVTNDTAPPQ